MVGRVGVEPTTSLESGFTVRRVCRFATDPYGPWGQTRTDNVSYVTDLQSAGFTQFATARDI